jgi:hypothetical protein
VYNEKEVGLNNWWTERAIPASRSGLREALEAMNIFGEIPESDCCHTLGIPDARDSTDKMLAVDFINRERGLVRPFRPRRDWGGVLGYSLGLPVHRRRPS